MEYQVKLMTTHCQKYVVEADSEDKAMAKAVNYHIYGEQDDVYDAEDEYVELTGVGHVGHDIYNDVFDTFRENG